ncbi:MAG: polysaccharide deacetylase family protein [Desulfitobacteriaceae bacterium]
MNIKLKVSILLLTFLVASTVILSSCQKKTPEQTVVPSQSPSTSSFPNSPLPTPPSSTAALPDVEERDIPSHALRPNNRTHNFPQGGIPVLMYHAIESIPGNSLGVPVEQFAAEMEYLNSQNYETLTLAEFYTALKAPSNKVVLPAKPILLTFDDGYADNYRSAWPILKRHGFIATFFVITDSVGPGMMTWSDLKDLSMYSNNIESHTVHHYDLATLPLANLEEELKQSKTTLEKQLSISVTALCYPSGRYNKQTLDWMPKVGYELGFTTASGKVQKTDNLLLLKRLRVPGGLSLVGFKRLLE